MKSIILAGLISFVLAKPMMAQSDSVITILDFNRLTGCWKGTLTYLDYTSNKPYTMPANIEVPAAQQGDIIVFKNSYPDEPAANSADTLFISAGGRRLNGAAVVSIKRKHNGVAIVTEETAPDGNDHKTALIRHTYQLGKKNYTLKKEVLFAGETKWILRHEYKFAKAKDCV